jgi:hypothetical protein
MGGMLALCIETVGYFDPLGFCPNLFGLMSLYHWVTLLFVLPALSYYVFFKKPVEKIKIKQWEYYGLVVLWIFLLFVVVVLKSALEVPFVTLSVS